MAQRFLTDIDVKGNISVTGDVTSTKIETANLTIGDVAVNLPEGATGSVTVATSADVSTINQSLQTKQETIVVAEGSGLTKAEDGKTFGIDTTVIATAQSVATVSNVANAAKAAAEANAEALAEQAEAILNIQLYRLSNTDVTALIKEADDLRNNIKSLEELLASPTKMNNLITKDLNAIKDKFADPRRTSLQGEEIDLAVDKRALITKEECMVVFTRDGYFKRCQMRSYQSSNGIAPGIKDGDLVKGIVKCNTTDYIIAFTTLGNYLFLPVYRLFDNKWKDEGKHINEIGSIAGNEKIVSGIVVSDFKEGVNVVMVSRLGQIKRSPLKEFEVTIDRKKLINHQSIEIETKIFKEINGLSLVDSKQSHVLLGKVLGLQTYINENKLFVRRKLMRLTNDIIDYYSLVCTDFRKKDYSKETKLLDKYKKIFNE